MMSAFRLGARVRAERNVVSLAAAEVERGNLEVVEVALERRGEPAPSLPPKSARPRSASA